MLIFGMLYSDFQSNFWLTKFEILEQVDNSKIKGSIIKCSLSHLLTFIDQFQIEMGIFKINILFI